MSSEPVFRFSMRWLQRPKDNYYATRWDLAMPLTVLASDREEATRKAMAALGKPADHQKWVGEIIRIDEVSACSADDLCGLVSAEGGVANG